MDTKQVAIACQGGGIHGAFTCGVLTGILKALQEGPPQAAARHLDICGLSGTSAGALNAFMTWYALMLEQGKPDRFAAARQAVNDLWDTFQVRKNGEFALNLMAQGAFQVQGLGVGFKPMYPPYFYDTLVSTLNHWRTVESLVSPAADFGEVRPEFYDFDSLLQTCAPEFSKLQKRLERIARDRIKPRLLIGAVEILSGEFDTFDSFAGQVEQLDPAERDDLAHRTEREARRRISFEAVAASGTLPEIRRSQRIPGLKNLDGNEVLYWDGLFSQNPPVRQFISATRAEDIPDEIWVVRINPQKRDREPLMLAEIEDRRNELAGNLSLNQELQFIQSVNKWIREDTERTGFAQTHKEIAIYDIGMSAEMSGKLDVASKFNRSPEFIRELRDHGESRAGEFLKVWSTE